MPAGTALGACLASLCLAATLAPAGAALRGRTDARALEAVTPMEKVMQLLTRLQKKLEAESEEDAKQYDKFACFCKEQLDEHWYQIEKSTKKIGKLTASINELNAEIAELDKSVGELADAITVKQEAIEEATEAREKQHATYVAAEADVSAGISALKGAIESLESSKDDMTDAKHTFSQLGAVVHRLAGTASHAAGAQLSQAQIQMVVSLAQLGQKPSTYTYHSEEIIETLQTLLKNFKNDKQELDDEEFRQQADFDKNVLNMKNEKKFMEKDKEEQEKISAMKKEQKETDEEEKGKEEDDKDADMSFVSELKGECEEKAKLWDQRSKVRAQELKAIADAIKILESEVTEQYKVNDKLVDLQTARRAAPHAARQPPPPAPTAAAPPQKPAAAPVLLQLRGASGAEAARAKAVRRAAALLSEEAQHLSSGTLAAAAVRVSLAEDHFVKVRSVIKDIVARLEADAEAEATQKGFCDENMAKTTEARDQAKLEIETLTGEQSSKEALQKEVTKDIAELSEAIAGLKKALLEATELRQAEAAENEGKISVAEEGRDGVQKAIDVLGAFYNAEPSLMQRRYDPPGADRSGKTVGDMAPDVFQGEYKGAGESSKGILGMLEVILADFERTIEAVQVEERAAQEAYDKFKRDTEKSIEEKGGLKDSKEGQLSTLGDELVELEGKLRAENKLLDNAKDTLQKLHKQCVEGEESYEERVANRKKEIEALKSAHEILENWQG